MKFLIDKEMYDAIVWMLPDATPIKEMVSALKPIESLSDPVIATIYFGATRQSLRSQDNMLAHSFAKAIEAHILGEKA